MKPRLVFSLLCLVPCLLAGAPLYAQENDMAEPANMPPERTSAAAQVTAANQAGTPVSSPAAEAPGTKTAVPLAVSDAANTRALTMSTPGACVVVDAFIRQFCEANPGDISCQFR